MLNIGRIDYANCTPIFQALQTLYPDNEYCYVSGVPSILNSMLLSGKIDVCPSSSIEFAIHSNRYLILPELSISSLGSVQSVLLFSSIPIELLDGKRVLLSSDSATSVNLLKILLKMKYGCNCAFKKTGMDINSALKEASAILLIGDAALRSLNQLPDIFVYDLGELWYQWTGKPFVFALWLTTLDSLLKQQKKIVELTKQLCHAKEYASANLEKIADLSNEVNWMERNRLLDYWKNNISYNLGNNECEGLKLFFSFATELGFIDHLPELSFLKLV